MDDENGTLTNVILRTVFAGNLVQCLMLAELCFVTGPGCMIAQSWFNTGPSAGPKQFGLLATDYSHQCQWPASSSSWAVGQTYLLAHQLQVYPRQHHSSGPTVAI